MRIDQPVATLARNGREDGPTKLGDLLTKEGVSAVALQSSSRPLSRLAECRIPVHRGWRSMPPPQPTHPSGLPYQASRSCDRIGPPCGPTLAWGRVEVSTQQWGKFELERANLSSGVEKSKGRPTIAHLTSEPIMMFARCISRFSISR